MISQDLRHVVEDLVNILGLCHRLKAVCAPAGDPAHSDRRKAAVARSKGYRPHAQIRGDICVRVWLDKFEIAPVVTEAELVHKSGPEYMGFAEHSVLGEKVILKRAVPTAVKNRTERRGSVTLLMVIAVTEIYLVLLADVPVHSLVPLPGIVMRRNILHQVVVGQPDVGSRFRGIKIQDLLRGGVNLIGAEHVGY